MKLREWIYTHSLQPAKSDHESNPYEGEAVDHIGPSLGLSGESVILKWCDLFHLLNVLLCLQDTAQIIPSVIQATQLLYRASEGGLVSETSRLVIHEVHLYVYVCMCVCVCVCAHVCV